MGKYIEPDFKQMARIALGLSLSGQVDNARDRFLDSRVEQVAKAMKMAHDMGQDATKRKMLDWLVSGSPDWRGPIG